MWILSVQFTSAASCSARSQEAKYVERWPNTTSAWAGWIRFDIPVDRYGRVHSLLHCTSRTLGSSTCHEASQQGNTYWAKYQKAYRASTLCTLWPGAARLTDLASAAEYTAINWRRLYCTDRCTTFPCTPSTVKDYHWKISHQWVFCCLFRLYGGFSTLQCVIV
jgi:hypothetical protein